MLKKTVMFVSTLFVGALAIQACTGTFEIGKPGNDNAPLPPDRSLRVSLADKGELVVEPYRYVAVTEPGDFIYGRGEVLDRNNDGVGEFGGRLPLVEPVRIETVSVASTVGWYGGRVRKRDYYYPLTDSSLVRLRSGDFVTVRRSQGPGLYCAGVMIRDGRELPFQGGVPFDDITRIEEVRFDDVKTVVLIVGATVAVALIVGAGMEFSSGWGTP